MPLGDTAGPAALVEFRRGDLVARLKSLDWSVPYPSDTDSEVSRLFAAASAVGLELATSEARDDGHWGGYQLRDIHAMQRRGGVCFEAIRAGYGFELDSFQVLQECRDVICNEDGLDDEIFTFELDLLAALAFPHGPAHQAPCD